jgi:DNA-binding NarL/FixJ family response regulator
MKRGPRPNERHWTPEEDSLLQKLLGSGLERELIARQLKRTVSAVRTRVYVLKAKGK